jgi:hypothetical protein
MTLFFYKAPVILETLVCSGTTLFIVHLVAWRSLNYGVDTFLAWLVRDTTDRQGTKRMG